MSVRVHNLSKQLNMENKELMALLKERGFDIRSASSTVDNISAEALLVEFASRITPESAAAALEPEPVAAPEPPKAAPPMGFVKSTDVLERERREREAAAKVPPVPPRPPAAPSAPAAPGPLAAPKLPPLPSKPTVAPPPPPARYPTMSAPALPPRPQPGNTNTGGSVVLPPPKSQSKPAQPSRSSQIPSLPPKTPATPPPAKSAPPAPAGASPSLPVTKSEPIAEIIAAGPGGKIVQIKPPIIVRDFATILGVKPFRLISEMMEMGIFASMNQAVDEEVAMRLGSRHGFTLEIKHRGEQAVPSGKKPAPEPVDETKFLEPRAPVVCVLGHVNHGKTTLLDAIRKTSVVAGEAGGITQHTGAYQIEHKGHKITFLDTPGHAAFSKMRERGANLTDIAVLVVAADDGFMPQTEEALNFAQQAGVPIIVAINKMDSKGANIDRVKQAMQQHGITSEDLGGETLWEAVSALKGQNIDKLLDAILLQAEILELKANPKAPAEGVVVDSQVEIGRGATATVIVEKGTLKAGTVLVCGQFYCKVRAMVDDHGEPLKTVPPGTPACLLGWSGAPDAGAKFHVVKNEREAKAETESVERASRHEAQAGNPSDRVGDLDALLQAIKETKQKVFRCIVKGDVHGTVEALVGCLAEIKSDKVTLEVVAAEVGPINENDITMASAAEAAVIGFNVRLETGVVSMAKHKGVRIIQHDIIYELLNQVREAMVDMLDPELRENKIGAAAVRQVFPIAKGFVAGCMVTEGRVTRAAPARVLRDGKALYTGRVGTLKRFKDDASEVRAGFECGLHIDGYEGYQPGDIIESFEILQIKPTL